MDKIIAYILLLPLVLWAIFTPPLYTNASQVEETLNLALFEGQKEASLRGKYDEEIYKMIRDFLVEGHNYRPDKIEIAGTETLTPRGERMYVEITIPRPVTRVIDIFSFGDTEPLVKRKYIMSEYSP